MIRLALFVFERSHDLEGVQFLDTFPPIRLRLCVLRKIEDVEEVVDFFRPQAEEAEGLHQLLEHFRDGDSAANQSCASTSSTIKGPNML